MSLPRLLQTPTASTVRQFDLCPPNRTQNQPTNCTHTQEWGHWTLKKRQPSPPPSPYAFPLPNSRPWKDSTAPSDERILCALPRSVSVSVLSLSLQSQVRVLKWFASSRHDDGFIVTTANANANANATGTRTRTGPSLPPASLYPLAASSPWKTCWKPFLRNGRSRASSIHGLRRSD
jgi:hypothetical protein